MTSSIRWTTRVGKETPPVCGFRKMKLARRHVRSHFLDEDERWDDLGPKRRPAHYRARFRTDDDLTCAVLDEAARDYVETVSRHAVPSRIVASAAVYRQEGRSRYPCLTIASSAGLFCAFHDLRPDVSHLTTAMRPIPAVVRGPLDRRHYVQEAIRKVKRGLS